MNIVGIDIAKKKFDVCLLVDTKSYQSSFSNNPDGFSRLQQWLSQYEVKELHVCLEATGISYEAVAEYLYQQGYKVSVVNPWQIKAYADSKLRRHKTDRLDAGLFADFCQ